MSRNSRAGVAERLLDLQIEISPALGLIDDLKEQLRQFAIDDGAGFTEEVSALDALRSQ